MAIRRGVRCVAVGVAALAVVAAAAVRPAGAQVVSVTVKSAGDLLDRFRALAKQADPASARQILDGLDALEQGGAIKWLDRTKPVALTGDLVAQAPGGPPAVPAVTLFMPVTGRDEFLEGLKQVGLAVDDQPGVEGFTHKVVIPGGAGQSAYLLADPPKGYAVLTTMPTGAGKLRAVDPTDLKPTRPGTVFVGLRLDQIPDQYKSAFLAAAKQRNDASRQRKDGETDAQYRGRLAGIAVVEDAVTGLVRDGRDVTLDADVDEKAETFTLALGVDARPGSAMARALGSFGSRRGRFLDLWGDAAVTLQGVLPVPESIRALIRKTLADERARVEKEKAPEDRRMIGLLLDALAPTLTSETFDACVAMGAQAPAGKGKGDDKGATNVVLFGVGMKDSEKVEAALREAIAKNLKREDRDKVALDHDKGADGTPIHKVVLDAKQLKADEFGDPLMFLAFPDGAALAAVGGNGLPVIKRALASLQKSPAGGQPGPQVGFEFAASRFAGLHTGENEGAFHQAAAEVFRGDDATKDRLRIALTGESGRVRLRMDTDLAVIRFLAKVGVLQRGKAGAADAK